MGEPVEDLLAKAKEEGNHSDVEMEEMLELDLKKVETKEPTFEMEIKKLQHSASIELDLLAMEDYTQVNNALTQLQHSASIELDLLAMEDDTQVNNAIIRWDE